MPTIESRLTWIQLGEIHILANTPGGMGASLDFEYAADYAARVVAEAQVQLAEDLLGREVRIGWWRWSPGCIGITIGLIALAEVTAPAGAMVAVGGAAGAVWALATQYKNVRDTVTTAPKDLRALWDRSVSFFRRLAPKLPKPEGVQTPPVLYRATPQEKPTDQTRATVAQIRAELIAFIENGGPELEAQLLEQMKKHRVRPRRSVLIWALDDRADEALLAELHEVARQSARS